MRLIIASDLHGDAGAIESLLRRVDSEKPDKIFLLGDILYHGPRNDLPRTYAPKQAFALLNEIASMVIAVRGNCDSEVDQMVLDFECRADYRIEVVDGHKCFLSHGHLAHMKASQPPKLHKSEAFMFGHSHVKILEHRGGVLFLNPGSTSIPKDGLASYASYQDGVFFLKELDGTVIKKAGWKKAKKN